MSSVLVARGLAAGHGDRSLFTDLDLTVGPGDVVGLVGPNGAGKSTLLRILAGEVEPSVGTVHLSPRTGRVGHLTQEAGAGPGETVRAWLHRRTGVGPATFEMEQAAEALAGPDPGAEERYGEALEAWMAIGGADLDDRIPAVAADLGLGVDLDLPLLALSGGQAARAGLAALLLSRYDLYLLDEPTNDLDIDGLALLEDVVRRTEAGIVVVSHDREFLSGTVTAVLELDRSLQRAALYGGTYDAYLQERSTARAQARRAYEDYAGRVGELEARARKQRAWMAKGVRNVRRKMNDEKDKNIRHFRGETSEKQAAKARQTERMIERLDVVEEPRKEWTLQFTIAEAPRSGDVVATLRSAVVRLGGFTLGPVDLQLDRGDRVAVTGPNGGGKSTLLRALLGTTPLASGDRHLGPGTVVGEIDQARAAFLGDVPLGRAFEHEVPDWSSADVRTLLAKFGLGADHVGRPAGSVSPGERTRAALALLQARGVNLLVLDEPTNHLDLPAIEQLESALDAFGGTFLLVTHDRRMLDTVLLTRRWEVLDGAVTEVDPD